MGSCYHDGADLCKEFAISVIFSRIKAINRFKTIRTVGQAR
jgi:hypothetical protein